MQLASHFKRHLIALLGASLLVTACGGGGSSTDSGSVAGTTSATRNTLFVADISNGAIVSFPDVNPTAGAVLSGRVLLPNGSTLGHTMFYDSVNDRLYASLGGSVAVFNNASTASAVTTPDRTFTPAGFSIVGFATIVMDQANDVLYIGGNASLGGVLAAIAHPGTASGSVQPTRTMTINEGLTSFAIDASRSLLYAVNSLAGVQVRTLWGASTSFYYLPAPGASLSFDKLHERLYVADPFTGVKIITNPHLTVGTAQGTLATTTAATVAINLAEHVTVDAVHDRLYVGARTNAYLFNNASALATGSSLPAAVSTTSALSNSSIEGFAFP